MIDFCPQGKRNSILRQEDHRVLHLGLLRHLGGNLPGLPLADSLYLCKAFRLFLNDSQCVCLKTPDNSCGQRRSDSLDRSRSEIPLQGGRILRYFRLIRFDAELTAVNRMLRLRSDRFDQFPLPDGGQGSDAGQLRTLHFQIQNGITVFFIAEYDMIHISLYCSFFHIKTGFQILS